MQVSATLWRCVEIPLTPPSVHPSNALPGWNVLTFGSDSVCKPSRSGQFLSLSPTTSSVLSIISVRMEATVATEGQGRCGQIQAHPNVNMGVYKWAQAWASMHDGMCRHMWTTMARTRARAGTDEWDESCLILLPQTLGIRITAGLVKYCTHNLRIPYPCRSSHLQRGWLYNLHCVFYLRGHNQADDVYVI